MLNLGFQAKAIGKLIANRLTNSPDETIVVHHITNYEDHVQVELERRTVNTVAFERTLLYTTHYQILHQYVHTIRKTLT